MNQLLECNVGAVFHGCRRFARNVYTVAEIMEGITEVYHCAAIVSFNPARRRETIHVNSETTCNVVNAALNAGVHKLVHFSSVAALGRDGTTKEITEEAQWEESGLNSAYALGKYAAEMEVWRGIGEGLDAVILNPGIILGEPLNHVGWHDGAPRLMQTAWQEFPFLYRRPDGFCRCAGCSGMQPLR